MQPSPDRSLPTPSPRRRSSLWIVLGVLLVAAAGGWWWKHRTVAPTASTADAAAGGAPPSGRRGAGPAGAAQPVSVEAVRRQDIRVTVNAIGSMTASNTTIVRTQVTGVVKSLNFQEGQQVKAGELLALIDPRTFQATLSQAEGTLARDKAQLDGARVDLLRYRDLLAKDAIPRQQLDTQVALVGQLEGTVKADQAAVDSARLQLSYTRVTAPVAGRVGLKQIDPGNVANPSDANGIVSITQTRPITMVFAVPSANAGTLSAQLRAKQAIPVQVWDRGGKTRLAEGQVAALDNAIDPTTDTLKVKAQFPNEQDALFPNQAVNVVLVLNTEHDVLAVPQAAVLRGAQGFYVYRVNADSTVSARTVTPGAADGGWMAVQQPGLNVGAGAASAVSTAAPANADAAPLQPGDRVVIDGTDRLREGGKVEVIASDPTQRAAALGATRASGHSRAASQAGGLAGGQTGRHASGPVSGQASGQAPGQAGGAASGAR